MSLHKQNPYILGIDSLLKEECVFLGTGFISREALEALSIVFAIEAVITKSDRKVNQTDRPTAVASWASEHGVSCFHADTRQQLDGVFRNKRLRSQFAVVVDYGVIISQEVIDYFPKGIINSHFSLLPAYRGADPIRGAMVAGETTTGVTLMTITAGLDAGPILTQKEVSITSDDTSQTLTEKLISTNSELLRRDLPRYLSGELAPTPQPDIGISWTRKLTKKAGAVSWREPAELIERKVRAYYLWPGVRTTIFNTPVQILGTKVLTNNNLDVGQVAATKDSLAVGTSTNDLSLTAVKPEGKRAMSAAEFLRGYKK